MTVVKKETKELPSGSIEWDLTGMLDNAEYPGGIIMESLKVAFIDGSSKQGNKFLASVGDNWVKYKYLLIAHIATKAVISKYLNTTMLSFKWII